MKRTILAAGLALGLTIAGASAPAFATPPPEECIPSDAWTEVIPDIEHPAVECEAPPVVVDPPTEEPPVVVPPVTEPPVEVPAPAAPAPLAAQPVSDGVGGDEPTTLAQTGGSVSPLAIGGGALALLVGALLVLRRRIFGTV